jgi:serine/threonine protein kinase
MSAREDERAKLEQEARVTASVNHPHVVRVYSFGEADGQFYLAMELVEKGSLDDLMSVQNRVSEAQVLEIGAQIAQGLEAAAEKGLVHRDVKPGNILFADAHTAKIVDFGLARVLEEEAEARGEIWGTPYYIAPERLNYEPEDFRSDIYSLGGTLFHAIAGRPPFEAESASLVALTHQVARGIGDQRQPLHLTAQRPVHAALHQVGAAERILDHFRDPFTLSGHRVFASPSIGISVFPGDGDDANRWDGGARHEGKVAAVCLQCPDQDATGCDGGDDGADQQEAKDAWHGVRTPALRRLPENTCELLPAAWYPPVAGR